MGNGYRRPASLSGLLDVIVINGGFECLVDSKNVKHEGCAAAVSTSSPVLLRVQDETMCLERPERESDDMVIHTASCPLTVDRPVMLQRWERLTFLHWSYDPAAVQHLLPDNLRVETHDGAAWVGLVPFFMRVTTAGGLSLGRLSNLCETNVRTYVRDHEGRSGVWFFSLDAARLGAVVVARTTYRLPYFWSSMRLAQRGDEIAYSCQRRVPGWPFLKSPTVWQCQ